METHEDIKIQTLQDRIKQLEEENEKLQLDYEELERINWELEGDIEDLRNEF